MEEKITLELTISEVLAIREAVRVYHGPAFVSMPLSSVYAKAWNAYKKPKMGPAEYLRRMDEAEEKFKNHMDKRYMISMEEREIKFYYELPEEVSG